MARFLWICLGGAFGTGVRYLLNLWAARALGPAFPYGTLLVNLIGCFLISILMHIGLTTTIFSPTLRMALTTGIMGGLTTYSTFNYETLRYLEEGAWPSALLNIGATFFGCLAAGILGMVVIRWALARA